MPILNMTDKPRPVGSGLPYLGAIRKGGEKIEGSNRPGKDLTFFRIDLEPQYAGLLPIMEEMYGKEPMQFRNVLLLQDEVDDAFATWMEEWSRTTLRRRCNGVCQVRRFDPTTGHYLSDNAPCEAPACECKQMGRLTFILGDLLLATGVLGVFTLVTHSNKDIRRIYDFLNDAKRITGRLVNLPMVLGRADEETSAPNPKNPAQRIAITKSFLWMQLMSETTKRDAIPALAATLAPQAYVHESALPMIPPATNSTLADREASDGFDDEASGGDAPPTELPDPDLGDDAALRTKFFAFVQTRTGKNAKDIMNALNVKTIKGVRVSAAMQALGITEYAELFEEAAFD